MRIFYKLLTAMLVTFVTCFSASAKFTVMVDNPQAFSMVMDDTGAEYTLNEGANDFETSSGSFLVFKLQSPWEMVSFTDPNGQDVPYVSYLMGGTYKLSYTSSTTGTFTIETRNPEAQSGPNITIDVNNPEAVVAELTVDWSEWNALALTGEVTTVPWGNNQSLRVKVAEGWEITSINAINDDGEFVPEPSGGWYYAYAGQNIKFTIRTQQTAADPTFLTVKLDNLEAVAYLGGDYEDGMTSIEPNLENGEYKIDTTQGGTLQMMLNPGWKVVSAPGFDDSQAAHTGIYGLVFQAGDTNTYEVTTAADAQSTFITLTLENQGAVKVETVIDDRAQEVQPQEGAYKIDTTKAGTIYVSPVDPWIITSVDGMIKDETTGSYHLDFIAGQTGNYVISTIKPTTVTIDIDNPEAITAKMTYDYQNYDTLELQAGENSFPVTGWGTVQITPNSPWVIDSYEGANLDKGIYYVNVDPQSNKSCKFTTSKVVTHLTLTLDNAEAVTLYGYYEDADGTEITPNFVNGECKIETTEGGLLIMQPNTGYKVVSAEGFQYSPDMGSWGLQFEAGDTNTYAITTEEDTQSTFITLTLDNEGAVKVETMVDDRIQEVQPQEGAYKIDTTTAGTIFVSATESWQIKSINGVDNAPAMTLQDNGSYTLDFEAGATAVYTITSEKKSEASYITVTVDHPEAITAIVEYSDYTTDEPTPDQEGVFKVETTKGGTLQVNPVAPWTIVNAEGFSPFFGGRYNLEFTAGQEGEYSITTKNTEDADPTYITLTVNNPEAVTVFVTYGVKEEQPVELLDGVYTIETTKEGGYIRVTPVSPWEFEDAGGLVDHRKVIGSKALQFNSGATGNYTITMKMPDTPEKTYGTLIIDNPEAINMAQVEYYDEEIPNIDIEIVEGQTTYKFETTSAGAFAFMPYSEWTILTYEGLEPLENPLGLMYYAEFEAGATPVYTITSVKTSEASRLKLNIDNPEGVTVQLNYEGEDVQEIEIQEGGTEILTIKSGDIMLTLKENWVMTSAPGFNQIPGTAKYLMHFDAGNTETYTISVNNEASVDSILGDEVIETAVFNMQGIKVADSTDNLAAGMYIIAGKKVVVK